MKSWARLAGWPKWLLLFLVIILAAVLTVFLRTKTAATQFSSSLPRQVIDKKAPTVWITSDQDGHGLTILARDFKDVTKVEMTIKYVYQGRENPPLLASGPPQQDSYRAHFRLESCSRHDCIYYPTREVQFALTLSYTDGESRDYSQVIRMNVNYDQTPLTLNPASS